LGRLVKNRLTCFERVLLGKGWSDLQMTYNRVTARLAVLMASVMLLTGPAKPEPGNGPKQPTSPAGVEVVYVTQYHSVQPKSIKRAPGPFLLIIVNRTTLPELNLSVSPVAAKAPAVAAGVLEGKTLEFLLDLPAGNYVIEESSRKDWSVDLDIH
jgi:hypothetical protein